MVKFCPSCGNQNSDDDFFCQNCGRQIDGNINPSSQTPQQTPQQQDQPMPIYPKKSKTGLIIGIIAIILIIFIIMAYFLFFLGSQDEENSIDKGKVVGTWNEDYQKGVSNSDSIWTFHENGDVTIVNNYYSSTITQTYKINGNMICFSSNDYSYYHCYDLSFDENNRMVLSAAGVDSIILSKV